jgi:hypothetical protein
MTMTMWSFSRRRRRKQALQPAGSVALTLVKVV